MNYMRVAHVFAADAGKFGGVQSHVYYITQALEKLGCQNSVFACSSKTIYPYLNYKKLGRAKDFPLPNGNWSSITMPDEKTDEIIKTLITKNFDLIHIHEPYSPFVNWQVISASKNIPVVTTFHAAWDEDSVAKYFLNPLIPLFKNNLAKQVQSVIYVSKLSQKRWSSLFHDQIRSFVIPNGIYSRLYLSGGYKKVKNHVKILFLSRLVRRKGLHDLLEALIQIQNKSETDFELTIVGEGPDKTRCRNFCQNHDLMKKCVFLASIDDGKKAEVFKESDIFVAPYRDEAFGITILEAMAAGCSIVGYQNDAFSEVLSKYPKPELLVKIGDVGSLAQALLSLIKDSSIRKNISIWCKNESQKYHWEKIAAETLRVYQDTVSSFLK